MVSGVYGKVSPLFIVISDTSFPSFTSSRAGFPTHIRYLDNLHTWRENIRCSDGIVRTGVFPKIDQNRVAFLYAACIEWFLEDIARLIGNFAIRERLGQKSASFALEPKEICCTYGIHILPSCDFLLSFRSLLVNDIESNDTVFLSVERIQHALDFLAGYIVFLDALEQVHVQLNIRIEAVEMLHSARDVLAFGIGKFSKYGKHFPFDGMADSRFAVQLFDRTAEELETCAHITKLANISPMVQYFPFVGKYLKIY